MVRAQQVSGGRKVQGRLLRQMLGPLVLAVGIFYFGFHALTGERGLYALLKEERKLEVLKADLDDVRMKRKELEHRVRLLSNGSLDCDLLDEQSRRMLNDASEDEVVIPIHNNAPASSDAH